MMRKGIVPMLFLGLLIALFAPVTGAKLTSEQPAFTVAGGAPGVVASREEVVYATLTPTGQARDVYVVSVLEVTTGGVITDYGAYTSVKNLTNTSKLTMEAGHITAEAGRGRFYYQGTPVNPILPWEITIGYALDGRPQEPQSLPGKTGRLEVVVSTAPAPRGEASFYENYILQVALTLDTSKFSNIEASGATVANAGRNKVINYTVMPGQPANLTLYAHVVDLSLPPIEITAIPMSMKLNLPDTSSVTSGLSELSAAIARLHEGSRQLKGGAQELYTGAVALSAGATQLNSGLQALGSQSQSLTAGSGEVMQALTTIAQSLGGLPHQTAPTALTELPQGLSQLSRGLAEISGGLMELKTGYSVAYSALDSAIQGIPDWDITQEELLGLYMANPASKPLLDKLVQYYTSARTVKGTYQATRAAFRAVDNSLTTVIASIDRIAATLESISEQVAEGLQDSSGAESLAQLATGLTTLAEQYNAFHSGFLAYAGGVQEAAKSYGQVHEGLAGLSQAVGVLYGGIDSLHEGTAELSRGTQNLPQQMQAEVDKMVGQFDKSGFTPVSFVSAKNSNTTAVQFVMRTEKIAKPQARSNPVETEKPETFWSRLWRLFKR